MKKLLLIMLAALAVSCIDKPEGESPEQPPIDVDLGHFQTAEAFEVPVKAGNITLVKADGVTLAEADSPMTIWVPRMGKTRAAEEGLTVEFVPSDEYPSFEGNKAQMFQVICFEDSYKGDYDYNDLVIHVMYLQKNNIFGFAVQPIALGSSKPINWAAWSIRVTSRFTKNLSRPKASIAARSTSSRSRALST